MSEGAPLETNPAMEPTLADLVEFVRSRFLVATVSALLLGGIVASIILVLPRKWEASALLAVVPPSFSSELKPKTLTIQGYQKLLESDEVIDIARRNLEQKGLIDKNTKLRLGHELRTEIYVARRLEYKELAPMIKAIVRLKDPKLAARVANEWATVFVERVRELMGGTTNLSVELIERQYPMAGQELRELEEKRVKLADQYQSRIVDAQTRWEQKIAQYKAETKELLAAYASETEEIVSGYESEKNLKTRREQLNSMVDAFKQLQQEQAGVEAELAQVRLELKAVEEQLARTEKVLVLGKAIPDVAAWQAYLEHGESALKKISSTGMLRQELNPVYMELAKREANLAARKAALEPRRAQLAEQLVQLSQELQVFDKKLSADEAQLEALKQERTAGYERLKLEREAGLKELEAKKKEELDSLARHRDIDLAMLDREIEQRKQLYSLLGSKYNDATIARAQLDVEDVRIGAVAVVPREPLPRRLALKSAAAAAFGFLIGLLLPGTPQAFRNKR